MCRKDVAVNCYHKKVKIFKKKPPIKEKCLTTLNCSRENSNETLA